MFFRHMLESHRFFCHQSQHFVLGNWWEYEVNDLGWPTKKAWMFVLRFPVAYAKFMYWAVVDFRAARLCRED
jgi:hypothetical protein